MLRIFAHNRDLEALGDLATLKWNPRQWVSKCSPDVWPFEAHSLTGIRLMYLQL